VSAELLAGKAKHACLYWKYGSFIWTAGHRIYHNSPNNNSGFAWKATSTNHYPLTYSNWNRKQPDNFLGKESCLNVWPDLGTTWNDAPCRLKTCFVCELEC